MIKEATNREVGNAKTMLGELEKRVHEAMQQVLTYQEYATLRDHITAVDMELKSLDI